MLSALSGLAVRLDWNTLRWNRRRYDLLAPAYDLATSAMRPARQRSLERLAPRAGDRVLFVGAGTGQDLPLLPAGVEAVALDLSPRMLAHARRRALRRRPRADCLLGDGQRLPLRDASVDHVALHLILAVAPDPVTIAREAARVLRPGGRIVVFDKFQPFGVPASRLRRGLNRATRVVATDITREAEPILGAAGLRIVHDEPAFMGSFFRILAVEPASSPGAWAGRPP